MATEFEQVRSFVEEFAPSGEFVAPSPIVVATAEELGAFPEPLSIRYEHYSFGVAVRGLSESDRPRYRRLRVFTKMLVAKAAEYVGEDESCFDAEIRTGAYRERKLQGLHVDTGYCRMPIGTFIAPSHQPPQVLVGSCRVEVVGCDDPCIRIKPSKGARYKRLIPGALSFLPVMTPHRANFDSDRSLIRLDPAYKANLKPSSRELLFGQ